MGQGASASVEGDHAHTALIPAVSIVVAREPAASGLAERKEHKMRSRRRIAGAVLAALATALAVVGVALGTPPAGVKSAPVTARGDFPDQVGVKFKFRPPHGSGLRVARAPSAGEVAVQQ